MVVQTTTALRASYTALSHADRRRLLLRLGVSESTLYPILRRLEEGRLLTVRSVEHNGRLRKYYHITDAGRGRIEDFKRDWHEMESIYRFITKGAQA